MPLAAFAQDSNALKVNGTSGMLADAAKGKKQRQGFFGAMSIGYLASTGNTDSASLNAKTSFGYVADPWRHASMLRAVKGSTDGATTAEEYEASEQSDYTFSKSNYVYAALNYNTNRFAGYDRRATGVLGYGRRLLESDTHTLDLQVGAGARQTRLADGTEGFQRARELLAADQDRGRCRQHVQRKHHGAHGQPDRRSGVIGVIYGQTQ